MRRTSLALALLCSCGPPPDYLPTCTHSVYLEPTNRYADLSANFAFARQVLAEGGIVKDEDFCQLYAVVDFYVRDAVEWDDPVPHVTGFYSKPTPQEGESQTYAIVVGHHLDALCHEMLHHLDAQLRGLAVTINHTDWETLGYAAADRRFVSQHHPRP